MRGKYCSYNSIKIKLIANKAPRIKVMHFEEIAVTMWTVLHREDHFHPTRRVLKSFFQDHFDV